MRKQPSISVLQNIGQLNCDPFPFASVIGALPEHIYHELEKSLPYKLLKENGKFTEGGYGVDGFENDGTGGYFRFNSATAIINGSLPPIWQDFFEYHSSEEYFRSVLELFEQPLSNMYPNYVEILSRPVGIRGLPNETELVTDCQIVSHMPLSDKYTTRTAHLDNPVEIYAGLFYMKPPSDESEGGNLELYEVIEPFHSYDLSRGREVPQDNIRKVAEIPYEANNLVLFLNTLESVHAVAPRNNPTVDRMYVNIIGEFNQGYGMWQETID